MIPTAEPRLPGPATASPEAGAPGASHPAAPSWLTELRFPLALWLSSRAALMLFSWLSLWLEPRPARPPPWQEAYLRPYPAIDGFCRWDCGWYLRIAQHGYREYVEANIWPLYPALARAFSELTRVPLIPSLIIVANIASLLSFVVLYRLFRKLEDERAAQWALGLFAAFPFAFFQSEAYPESLLVLATALAVLWALEGKPLRAGVALGLGALARHLVILAGAALLMQQWRERPSLRAFVRNRAFLGLVIPFLIVALYPLHLALVFHDPLAFWNSRQQGWGGVAWMSVFAPFLHWRQMTETPARYVAYPLFSLVPAAGALVLARQRRWELFAYTGIFLLVCWGIGAEALGRYCSVCWPAFLGLGAFVSRRPAWQLPLLLALALFQGLFFFLFIHNYPIV